MIDAMSRATKYIKLEEDQRQVMREKLKSNKKRKTIMEVQICEPLRGSQVEASNETILSRLKRRLEKAKGK